MLDIEKVDHVGIRVSNKDVSVAFYQSLGFELITDVGFDNGHPVIMRHSSGDVLNLLGPAVNTPSKNILMDIDEKHAGITHVSYKVKSIPATKKFLAKEGIPLSGEFEFKGLHAIFFRDPDLNVIELDGYKGQEPGTRAAPDQEDSQAYDEHP